MAPSRGGLAEIGALLRRLQRNYVATLGTVEVVVIIVMALTTHGSFLRTSSLRTSFVDIAVNLGPAVGLTMVILTGGIDVSVASVVAADASAVGLAFEHGVPFILVLFLGLLGGALAGAINALLIVVGKIPPIVATLATSSIWLAVSFWALGGNWITAIPSSLSTITSISGIGPLPWSLVFLLAVTVCVAYFMHQRWLGRVIYAVGNNLEAAKTSGLPVARAEFIVYVTIGLLTGLATLLLVGQSPVVSPETGANIFLPVLAAVVVGGTSITGGRGSVLGSVLGVVLVELVNDAVVLYHVNPFWDDVVLGVIIVVAVMIGLGSRYTATIGEGKL
jgi:ribose/xylose/arabinose/galactoside ABC-type transport system permease subunit